MVTVSTRQARLVKLCSMREVMVAQFTARRSVAMATLLTKLKAKDGKWFHHLDVLILLQQSGISEDEMDDIQNMDNLKSMKELS